MGGVGRIVIDRPDDRANAIDQRMIEGLAAAVAEARRASPRAVIVASAKPGHFVAGADITVLGHVTQSDVRLAARTLHRVLDDLASLPCVTVAAINGGALGGGLELALACDWRVAADEGASRIGLPEVQLGLICGAGGTQRLPRLVGLVRALDLILGARRLAPRRALRAGIVDEVVHPAALERAALDRAMGRGRRKVSGGASAWERAVTWLAPLRGLALWRARARVRAESRGHYQAPLRALEAIAIGLRHGMARGLEAEADRFAELATGDVARNLIALFLATRRQRHAVVLDGARPLRSVGVVGAGFMGSGIAQLAAAAGMRVRMKDTDHAAVTRALATVRALTSDAARKGAVDRREAARILGRISGTADWSGFGRADLVVEAVFEDLAAKRAVLRELEAVVREDCVIASNTSAIPIAEIARRARVPERVVGMHFFSPVHRMQLVEVVRPPEADDAAIATAVGATLALGKTPIVVRDGPGFYTSRVIGVMLAEALLVLEEGARLEDVDRAMTAFGWPVGPFVLLDEVGLEVARHAGETVARAHGEAQPRALGLLVDAGLKGKRVGEGFYRYRGRRRSPNPRVRELLGVPPTAASGDLAERLTLAFVNEAARCLDQEVLRSPVEGDLGAVLGLGFPPFLGGPFRYADARGVALRDALCRLAERVGPRFAPARCLAEGSRFFKT